jgi:hypothetical protein
VGIDQLQGGITLPCRRDDWVKRGEILALLAGMAAPSFRIGVLVVGNADPEFFMQPFQRSGGHLLAYSNPSFWSGQRIW